MGPPWLGSLGPPPRLRCLADWTDRWAWVGRRHVGGRGRQRVCVGVLPPPPSEPCPPQPSRVRARRRRRPPREVWNPVVRGSSFPLARDAGGRGVGGGSGKCRLREKRDFNTLWLEFERGWDRALRCRVQHHQSPWSSVVRGRLETLEIEPSSTCLSIRYPMRLTFSRRCSQHRLLREVENYRDLSKTIKGPLKVHSVSIQ